MSGKEPPPKGKMSSRLARMVTKSSPARGEPAGGEGAGPTPPRPPPFGREARLGRFVASRGVGVHEVLRALADAARANDKAGRAQLGALLLRLFYFEELPPEAAQLLAPLLQSQAKDARTLRSLYYLAGAYVGPGSAGTPTLYDPALVGKRPDEKALAAVLGEVWRLLQSPALDPAVARASFYLAAAAARGSSAVRKQLVAQVGSAIAAADAAAAAAGPLGKSPRGVRSAAQDWGLQHTAFATCRMAGAANGADEISRSFGVGVGSGDPVGARHALAMGCDVALRDAGYVVREVYQAVADAAQAYEAAGPGPHRTPGAGVNLEDAFARLYLARLCAHVVHSDQSATDVARDGAPFWRMLCLLAARDPVDLVRFGAIEALAGATAGTASLSGSKPGSGREETVSRQRRGRAWRLLVAQAGMQVAVPGAAPAPSKDGKEPQAPAPVPTMKLIDLVGRLLLAALRKGRSAARFCVAAGAVASLAESALASQTAGSTRHGTSPDVDRVLGVLAAELGGLVDGGLRPAERCAVTEALLYLQAAGYTTSLSPAKLVQAGSGAGGTWSGGMQDALLTAVLKCARAKPRDAATFLGYATAVVGISPSGIDLAKITDLWDAAVAAGKEGRAAVLDCALDALGSPPPPAAAAARAGAGAGAEVARATREEDGWNTFVATAAWWLGEHANELCEEFSGARLQPAAIPAAIAAASDGGQGAAPPASARSQANGDGEFDGSDESEDREADAAAAAAVAASAASAAELMQQFGGRSPTLSRILLALQNLMLTAVWQLRLAAAQALAKIAVRSGEPYRLQAYSLLAAAADAGAGAGGGEDALGLGPAVRPALALLDQLYSTQVVLDGLWAEHGDDPAAWPKEVVASLARRNSELARQAERHVCSVPRARYSLLGHRAALVLAADEEAGDGMAAFLRSTTKEEETVSDRTGERLAANKSKEVDAILGSHASDDAGSTFRAGGSVLSDSQLPTLDDRNKEIDRLLSGGGLERQPSEPWGFAPAGSSGAGPGFNAFAEGGEPGASFPALASPAPGSAASTLKFGARAGSGDWAAARDAASPTAGEADGGGGGARVIGTGTVLHTFVGDYAQPEELSVFEGDQVEVLEEADGWMLVRDPGGREGLVPTSYLQLDALYQQNLQSAAAAEAAAAAAEYQRQASGTPTRAHRRGASVDYGGGAQQSKEDMLDNIFSSYQANPAMPTMPEEAPFGEPYAFGAPSPSASASVSYGGAGGEASTAATAEYSGYASGGGGAGPNTGGSLSPVARQDSFTAGTGRSDSMWAQHPLRQDSSAHQRPASDQYVDEGMEGGASGSGALLLRQGSAAGSTGISPAHAHAHRRTLSTASSGGMAAAAAAFGSDPYDAGSMPNTPSRVEGPERAIVAGFVGELEGELTVDLGDRVKVHSEVDGWARVIRLSDNRTGLVPSWAVALE